MSSISDATKEFVSKEVDCFINKGLDTGCLAELVEKEDELTYLMINKFLSLDSNERKSCFTSGMYYDVLERFHKNITPLLVSKANGGNERVYSVLEKLVLLEKCRFSNNTYNNIPPMSENDLETLYIELPAIVEYAKKGSVIANNLQNKMLFLNMTCGKYLSKKEENEILAPSWMGSL